MSRTTISLAAALLAVWVAAEANAITIDFDALANGAVVTTQYPGVVFSSQVGFDNKTSAQSLGSSLPNFICSGPVGGGIDCVHDTYLDFATPVNGLQFLAVGVDDSGSVAKVNVFQNNVFSTSVNVVGNGSSGSPDPVDLSAFANITRIEINSITDTAGIGWDDFTFTPAVPEPSTIVLLLASVLSCGWSRSGYRSK